MAEDELDELAADIKTNGLQQPIVLADFADEETGEIVTMLVDGRNQATRPRGGLSNRTSSTWPPRMPISALPESGWSTTSRTRRTG